MRTLDDRGVRVEVLVGIGRSSANGTTTTPAGASNSNGTVVVARIFTRTTLGAAPGSPRLHVRGRAPTLTYVTVSYASSSKGMLMQDPTPKPRLRGWFHLGMAPVVQVLGLALIVVAPSIVARLAIAIYLVGATMLFGTSALYHRGTWQPRLSGFLRRLDHANIFVFIAGTYTPLALLLLDRADATLLLALVWGIAVAGIAFKLGWMNAPRWLYTGLYLAMGWVAVGWLGAFWSTGGALVVSLIIAGGLIYTAGAVVYALKRPDPAPAWFGYHEIFHVATVVAALCHFAAIAIVTLR